jgi:hypothetical protein
MEKVRAAQRQLESFDLHMVRVAYFCGEEKNQAAEPWLSKLDSFIQLLHASITRVYIEHVGSWKANLDNSGKLLQSAIDSDLLQRFMKLLDEEFTAATVSDLLTIVQDARSKHFYQEYKAWDGCRVELMQLAADPEAECSLDGVDLRQSDAIKVVASMTIVQALQRPLKQNESRISLARKCRSMIWAKGWDSNLPAKLDILLSQAHGEFPKPEVGCLDSVLRRS